MAEYKALLFGIKSLKNAGNLLIIGDSKRIIQQLENVRISNKYKNMQQMIYNQLQYYDKVEYVHQYREFNKTADH